MPSKYYIEAEKLYVKEHNYVKAVQVCEEGIKNNEFDCAYLKGKIYLEVLKDGGVDYAVQSFQVGTKNGNKQCLYELAKIYNGKSYKKYENYFLSLQGYFDSGFIVEDDHSTIISMLEKEGKRRRKGNSQDAIEFLQLINNCEKQTTEYRLLYFLEVEKFPILEFLVDNVIMQSKNVQELDQNFLNIYNLEKEICSQPLYWDKYELKRSKFFLTSSPTVLEAENYLLRFKEKRGLESEQIIQQYIARSYVYGKNGVRKDYNKAREWYCKINSSSFSDEFDEKIGIEIMRAIEIKRLDEAKDRIPFLINKEKSRYYQAKICRAENKNPLEEYILKANRGDYTSMKILVDEYRSGKIVPQDIKQALFWAYQLFDKYKDKSAFSYLIFENYENKDKLKKLFIEARKKGIIFTREQEEQYQALMTENATRSNKQNDLQTSNNLTNSKRLIILDLDGTIFDTDRFRKERNSSIKIPLSKLSRVEYILGFEETFLRKDSFFFLGNYDVIIVSSSPKEYVTFLLDSHPKLKKYIKYYLCGSKKKKIIRNFLSKHQDYGEIYAFGDDEKDANVYAKLDLKFYIVKNGVGYPSQSIFIKKELNQSKNNFRKKYLYDYKTLRRMQERCGKFSSDYFDDIVVYFKCYNVTNNHYAANENKGSDYCPPVESVMPIKNFDKCEFKKANKNQTIIGNLDYFSKIILFDLPIDMETVLVRIPGHDEVEYDESKPMSRVIKEVIKNHNGQGIDGSSILRRSCKTDESKNGNRIIEKHLQTIYVDETKRGVLKGKTVFLLDDISTSGASLVACTELLYRAGAGHVICICLARTCGYGKFAPVEIE